MEHFPYAFPALLPDVPIRLCHNLHFTEAVRRYIEIEGVKGQRVYILASKSLAAQTPHVQTLAKSLGSLHVGTWDAGIPSHTPFADVVNIVNDMREKRADCLIVIGGGSVVDGGKVIRYALANDVKTVEDLRKLSKPFRNESASETAIAFSPDFRGVGQAPSVPQISMPTTLSGAEYTRFGAATDPENNLKIQFSHPKMFASLIVLSADLCASTPDWVWLSTGVRSVDHCVETLCSPNVNEASDSASKTGLVRLLRSLPIYKRDKHNAENKLEAQLGVRDALTGLNSWVYLGASHGIGHMLGPLGVGHGQTSCILLPAVMKFNKSVTERQQEVIKQIIWEDDFIAGVLQQSGLNKHSSDASDALRAIFVDLGMPRSLKDVGVGRDKWDELARNSLFDHLCKENPIPLEREEQVKEILAMVEG